MKCVITAAGLGTRLFPLTKDLPKEMLPIYSKAANGELILKPILQVIFESLYNFKIRDYCFIVGRSKRLVEEHFTSSPDLLELLKKEKKEKLHGILKDFFNKLDNSNIAFTFQPKPISFGDAIYKGKNFAGNAPFLLHAGDDIVISKNNDHLVRLHSSFKKYKADIAFLIEEVENPTQYGVVNGPMLEDGVMDIKEMQEKPKKPKSKHAIIAIYIFSPKIFYYLSKTKNKAKPQNHLADAFNMAIKEKSRVIGVSLKRYEKRIDIGTPKSYADVLVSLK